MSNQISLTIPNDDPIALRAFGNALEEMAVAHGAEVREPVVISQKHTAGGVSVETVMQGITDDTDHEALAALDEYVKASVTGEVVPYTDDDTQLATNDTLDADGLPWDARIHSSNQERNADNTWRVRRRPKDLTPEQWAEQVAQVRDELFALMAIPVADPAPVVDDDEQFSVYLGYQSSEELAVEAETVTADTESPAAIFGEVPPAPESLPVVTVADPVPPAPEPIADPVPPAPAPLPPAPAPLQPVAATGAIPTTMADFMTSLTKYGPKDPSNKDECAAHVARVNEIVARHGLVSVGQLAKRLDLIPQVYTDLVKELGV